MTIFCFLLCNSQHC